MARKQDTSRFDPEGTRLPIKLDTTTNGEFAPRPLELRNHAVGAASAATLAGINLARDN